MPDLTIGASFDTPAITGPCGFFFGPMSLFAFSFTLKLPDITFPPPLPTFNFAWNLSCDPKKPIDIQAGLSWGGGRTPKYAKDPSTRDD